MDFHAILEFVGSLTDTQTIFMKNGKLMTLLTLFTLLINSLFYLANLLLSKPFVNDFGLKLGLLMLSSPSSPEFIALVMDMKRLFGFYLASQWIILLFASIMSLILTVATLFAAAAAIHRVNNLNFKDLLLMSVKTWKRPFITVFYTSLLIIGYIVLVMVVLVPVVLIIESPAVLSNVILILAGAIFVYLSIVWTLGLVVSVLEEKRGVEALAKAGKLVEGMKIHGFVLNGIFALAAYLLSQGMKLIGTQKSTVMQVIIGLVVVNCISLVRVVSLVAFYAYYSRCKETHGEEVGKELEEGVEYSEVPNKALMDGGVV